jgi:hypothetical protein
MSASSSLPRFGLFDKPSRLDDHSRPSQVTTVRVVGVQERAHVSVLKISDLQMGFGQIKKKLSNKKRVIKEKSKGAVIFGSKAKNLRRNKWHANMTLWKRKKIK